LSSPANRTAREIGRFSLAGVINTIVGYGVIFGLQASGVSPYASNMVGYAAGLTCAFLLNRYFVFSARGRWGGHAIRFLVAFVVAYGLNLTCLHAILSAGGNAYLAQAVAGVAYLVPMFLMSRNWVFRSPP